ncbi:MAG: HD-GYP domain-containing protein [Anaerolineae bacterium]|nr:HD-GYP domain-containing protein [Anaerolineae bacterium]MCI0611011.1 HD-GYP domain-containing protein [Anaerolineae bacterium]
MQAVSVNISLLKSLLSLATVIEAKDPYTGGHTWRVSRYARLLAESLGLSEDEVFIVHFGSLLHDIGKVSVPEPILNKQDKLTSVEYEIIKKHPETGLPLVREHPLGALALDIVASHHERFDGGGYPKGLAGNDIRLFARIVAIVDAFDAMTSARPYRAGMQAQTAYQLMAQESGRQFDPVLLSAFLDLGKRGELDQILGHSSEERLMQGCPECGPIIVIPVHWQSGDKVICPKCLSNYNVHPDGDKFEVEWDQTVNFTWIPEPDTDTISEVAQYAPKELGLQSDFLEFSVFDRKSYDASKVLSLRSRVNSL